MNMRNQEWIKTLEDSRKVKFIYQELPEDGAFIPAQIAGHEVVYSVVLSKAGNPLSREDVESHSRASFLRSSTTTAPSSVLSRTSKHQLSRLSESRILPGHGWQQGLPPHISDCWSAGDLSASRITGHSFRLK